MKGKQIDRCQSTKFTLSQFRTVILQALDDTTIEKELFRRKDLSVNSRRVSKTQPNWAISN